MAYTGINFRATAGFVTDGAGDTYSLGEAYPTTRGGFTFGWNTNLSANTRDRGTSSGAKLAGIVFFNNAGSPATFTIDLPAGTYKVRLALGDLGGAQRHYVRLKDGATVRATIGPTDTTTAAFLDAQGTSMNDSAWPSTNVPVDVVITGSALTLELGGASGTSGNSTIAHIAWELQAPSAPELTGNISLDAVDPTGTLGLNPSTLGASTLTLDSIAPTGTLGIAPGTVTTLPFSRNTGSRPTGLTGVAVAILSDDANMTRLAGSTSLSQDGSGRIIYSGAGLPAFGTSVLVVTRESDGKLGLERYTVG